MSDNCYALAQLMCGIYTPELKRALNLAEGICSKPSCIAPYSPEEQDLLREALDEDQSLIISILAGIESKNESELNMDRIEIERLEAIAKDGLEYIQKAMAYLPSKAEKAEKAMHAALERNLSRLVANKKTQYRRSAFTWVTQSRYATVLFQESHVKAAWDDTESRMFSQIEEGEHAEGEPQVLEGAIYGSHDGVVRPYFSSLIGPPCYYAVKPEVLKEKPISDLKAFIPRRNSWVYPTEKETKFVHDGEADFVNVDETDFEDALIAEQACVGPMDTRGAVTFGVPSMWVMVDV
jgi:hypothetical protein